MTYIYEMWDRYDAQFKDLDKKLGDLWLRRVQSVGTMDKVACIASHTREFMNSFVTFPLGIENSPRPLDLIQDILTDLEVLEKQLPNPLPRLPLPEWSEI